MAEPVYEYMMEIRLTNKHTKAASVVVYREWAYSIRQAMEQACIRHATEIGNSDLMILAIGPAPELIAEASRKPAPETIPETMKRLRPGLHGASQAKEKDDN